MSRFVTIDFETANEQRGSACAAGAVVVEEGEVVHRWSTLIDPETSFSAMNSRIHGIEPDDVVDAPSFREASEPLMDLINKADVVTAHSAAFDIQVMRASASRYDLNLSPFRFACTRVFARQWFPGWASYGLTYCTAQLGINERLAGSDHHNPAWDAEACALIAIRGLEQHNYDSWDDAAAAHQIRLGTFEPEIYRGCIVRSRSPEIAPTPPERDEFDPDHPLYDTIVTFTGSLAHYVRREAAQLVVDRGGHFSNSVTKATDLLVVGEQNLAKLAGHVTSSKMRKAAQMAADGHRIEIIDEVDFYRML